MSKSKVTRRQFIKSTAVAGAALAFPTIIPATALGKGGKPSPSERVTVALIGCGGRSGYSINYKNYPKSEVIAVCDPIKSRRLMTWLANGLRGKSTSPSNSKYMMNTHRHARLKQRITQRLTRSSAVKNKNA